MRNDGQNPSLCGCKYIGRDMLLSVLSARYVECREQAEQIALTSCSPEPTGHAYADERELSGMQRPAGGLEFTCVRT
jgi:hypothetical protein